MKSPSQIRAFHNQAMELAGRAFQADVDGDIATAEKLFREAYNYERSAAEAASSVPNSEPTRSILLRSAASLALDCGEFREAERLIAMGLAGDPPAEICEELRDLLEAVHFRRHLSLRGLELAPIEFQMTLIGGAVGPGFIESSQFVRRAETVERMLIRTAERKHGVPFREGGAPNKEATRNCQVYLSVPRAASYAITVRLGRPRRQLALPFAEEIQPASVVDEVLGCLEDFGTGRVEKLHAKIGDEAYFNNFTALATRLSPDGEKIKTVGFTSTKGDIQHEIALTSPPAELWKPRVESGTTREYVGRILAADETSKMHKNHPFFRVENEDGVASPWISVPPGMLQDIVKPYWGESVRVIVSEKSKGKNPSMIAIDPIDSPGMTNGAIQHVTDSD